MTARAGRTPLRGVRLATPQATVAEEISIAGVGTFGGEECCIALRPTGEDSGIVFCVGGARIPCVIDHLVPQAADPVPDGSTCRCVIGRPMAGSSG